MDFYSRKNDDGSRFQTTYDHISGTAYWAEHFGREFGFPVTAKLAAILHDIGKLSQSFNDYLLHGGKRGSVTHSTQGAKFITEAAGCDPFSSFIAQVVALAVAGHHGGLADSLTAKGETPFAEKLGKTDESLCYAEISDNFNTVFPNIDISEMLHAARKEFLAFYNFAAKNKIYEPFAVHMICKLVFSALIDADRYNAYLFETDNQAEYSDDVDFETLSNKLEISIDKLNANADFHLPINDIRRQVSEQCFSASQWDQGIYKLEVPTGGGKTLAGLRFALNHAVKHHLRHIIYVIPYLSILEQTAKELREKLQLDDDDNIILEHHSNILFADENEQQIRLLTSRWDSPIIVTTMVQLLESMFSAKSGELRKLHNMTRSVIVFDEIQSLPVKCMHLFNEAMNFLSGYCCDTIVLCSATQPPFDGIKSHPLRFGNAQSLINRRISEKFGLLKRTEVNYRGEMDCDGAADLAVSQFEAGQSCLIIVNTRSSATKIYRKIKSLGINAYHVSTNMCRDHRDKVIGALKAHLKRENGTPALCVSTQLIEAGVDISFGCVIRSLAGLDSIAQAAGRCNRSGEFGETKAVYAIRLTDENLSRLPDIKIGADISERIFRDMQKDIINTHDALSKTALDIYYEYYFFKRKDIFDYPIDIDDETNKISSGITIFDLLSLNITGKEMFEKENNVHLTVLPYAFETAGSAFSIIEKDTQDVVVENYNDVSRALVAEYISAPLSAKSRLLRKLGKYSVSLWNYQYSDLMKKHAISERADGLLILADGFYESETGLDMDGKFTALIT
jgi:CRISPR-associated endonuclease/helicase Cas3